MGKSKTSYKSLLQDSSSSSRASLDTNGTAHNEDDLEDQRLDRSISLYRISVVNAGLLVVLISLFAWHMVRSGRSAAVDDEPSVLRAFGSNEQYMSLDHEYDSLWDALPVRKAGVIGVAWDDEGAVTEIGAISMFHQLHCLVAFRWALQKAYEGGKVAFDFHEDQHWPHCLYYLRQAILCQADGQIEAQRIRNGSRPSVDGAGDIRKCGDSKELYNLFNERKVG